MSKMHFSPHPTETLFEGAPQSPLRPAFLQALQKEQDDALSLLESNPILASIFMKYATSVASGTGLGGSMVSRTRYEYLQEDYEDLNAKYKEELAEAEEFKKVLCLEIRQEKSAREEEGAAHAESKVLLEAAKQATEQKSVECAQLRDDLETSRRERENEKVEHDAALLKQQKENKKLSEKLVDARKEIEKQKVRYSVLLEVKEETQRTPIGNIEADDTAQGENRPVGSFGVPSTSDSPPDEIAESTKKESEVEKPPKTQGEETNLEGTRKGGSQDTFGRASIPPVPPTTSPSVTAATTQPASWPMRDPIIPSGRGKRNKIGRASTGSISQPAVPQASPGLGPETPAGTSTNALDWSEPTRSINREQGRN